MGENLNCTGQCSTLNSRKTYLQKKFFLDYTQAKFCPIGPRKTTATLFNGINSSDDKDHVLNGRNLYDTELLWYT